MRVIVTGAAGFIGSHLCEALLARGDEVVGVDNFNDYYDPEFKRKNIKTALSDENFHLFETDIRSRDKIGALFQNFRPDAVVHLAAMAGVRRSVEQPHLYWDVNINGSQSIYDAARAVNSVKNVVFASTSSVYGMTDQIPFLETDPCTEPLQPYSASKRSIELLARTYYKLYNLPSTVVRFFTVYGPRGRPDMMPMLLANSIAHGTEIPYYGDKMERDWTYVHDIVCGLLLAVDKPLGFEIINLGRGEPVLLSSFITAMEEWSGGKANLRNAEKPAADVYRTFANIEKAARLLGYSPQVSVKEGVSSFWNWFAGTHLKRDLAV